MGSHQPEPSWLVVEDKSFSRAAAKLLETPAGPKAKPVARLEDWGREPLLPDRSTRAAGPGLEAGQLLYDYAKESLNRPSGSGWAGVGRIGEPQERAR